MSNSQITLSKASKPITEAMIAVREEAVHSIRRGLKKFCNNEGQQKTNLTPPQQRSG